MRAELHNERTKGVAISRLTTWCRSALQTTKAESGGGVDVSVEKPSGAGTATRLFSGGGAFISGVYCFPRFGGADQKGRRDLVRAVEYLHDLIWCGIVTVSDALYCFRVTEAGGLSRASEQRGVATAADTFVPWVHWMMHSSGVRVRPEWNLQTFSDMLVFARLSEEGTIFRVDGEDVRDGPEAKKADVYRENTAPALRVELLQGTLDGPACGGVE